MTCTYMNQRCSCRVGGPSHGGQAGVVRNTGVCHPCQPAVQLVLSKCIVWTPVVWRSGFSLANSVQEGRSALDEDPESTH